MVDCSNDRPIVARAPAALTMTDQCKQPGHLLFPGPHFVCSTKKHIFLSSCEKHSFLFTVRAIQFPSIIIIIILCGHEWK